METWFMIIVSLCIAALIKPFLFRRTKTLPPGPSLLHSSYLLLTNHPSTFQPLLIHLKATYGPIFTLSTALGPSIFVADHSLAHQLLVKKGALFSDRPNIFINFNISTAPYGPTWRLLRRNLVAGIIKHPNCVKSFSDARKWALRILFSRLLNVQELYDQSTEGGVVNVVDHFRHAIFSLMVVMCFGEKFDDCRINEIDKVQRDMQVIVGSSRFTMLVMFPKVGKVLFRNIWKKFEKLRDDKEHVLVPIIKSRIQQVHSESDLVAYIDTLVNLNLPVDEVNIENGRKLTYREMVGMCSEFLTGGTDTTASALQWIMANLVKYPQIQKKVYDEIVAVVGPPPRRQGMAMPESVISEEELKKMRYVKAVVLEGLRRHPPANLVLPHRVVKKAEVEGFVFPEGAIVNFMVGAMGLDPKVWDEPMEFKPERFMGEGDGVFDVSGSKGIKMMPFGAGRRVCPGFDLALFHLEYFVANLIWYCDWGVVDGYDVDLTEKSEFTVVMKNPLRARVTFRDVK